MGDEEYTDDDSSEGGVMQTGAGPMAVLANIGSQYTSKEAHDLARRAYTDLQTERSEIGQQEDQYEAEMQAAADDAKAQLQAARQRLLAKKYDQSEKWLAIAEGLGSPTRSGSFGETVGNVAHNMREVNANRRKFEDEQDTGVTAFGQQMSAIDRTMAQARIDLAKARATNNTRLMQEAMKTLGREVRPGAGAAGRAPPSKNGKIAFDEGLQPGTPEFVARVRELNAIDVKNAAATAGTDAPQTPEEEQIAKLDQAHQFGVPVAVIDPYKGLSTKQKNAALGVEQKETQKRLDALATVQTDAAQGIANMNRFLSLNRKVDSGAFKGLFPALSDAGQQMDAITSEASRKMKQPGEGSTSDFDAKMFIKATVSRTKNFQANRGIATAYKIMRKNEIDRISFLQDYAALNGHLRGADAAWRSYLESNPIFDKAKPDDFVLNQHRKDYKTFFREQMGDKPAEGPDPGEGDATADDDQPGHFAGEDRPAVAAYAEGGKVSSAGRLFYNITHKGQKVAGPYSRRASAMNMHELLSDKHPDKLFHIDPVKASSNVTPGDAYADGGPVVTDEDVYGDPPDDSELTADGGDEDDGTDHLREALYAALQGGTLGTADEIRGTVDPEGAASDRAEYSEYASAHPGEKAGAFSAGLLPLALAAASAVPGGGVLTGAGLGAATGAGLGATSNVEDRGTGALEGGIEGGLAGAGATIGTRYIYNKLGQLIDKATGKALTPAEEKIVLAANRDKIDLSQVAADLRASDRINVPQGVQDVGGRRTKALVEKAATRGGDEAENFLAQQQGIQDKSYSRVEDQVNKGLAPSEYFGELEKLQNELYTNSKPLYEAAYKKYPGIKSKVFDQIASTKDGKDAIREAFRLMENDQVPIGKVGPGGMVQKPSLQFLDYVKRGLDQKITTEEANGATPLGKSLRAVRNRLRDELDKAAPEYKTARDQYAGDLEIRDALKMGREDLNKMQPEEVRKAVANMSFAEKDAFRSGVSQHLFETLGKPTTDFNAAQRILGSDAMREKLKATFDDPKKWKIFEAAMDKEAEMFQRNKQMLSRVEGKKTQALGKEDSILSNVLDGGMTNAPGMGGISWTNRIYNWLRFPMPMSEKTADEVLKTINRGDIKAFDATMKRLASAQQRLRIRGKRSSKAGALAAVIAAGLMQPTPPGEAAKMDDQEGK